MGNILEELQKELQKSISSFNHTADKSDNKIERKKEVIEAREKVVCELVDCPNYDVKDTLPLNIDGKNPSHFEKWLGYKSSRETDCDKSILAEAVYATLWYDADEEKDWYKKLKKEDWYKKLKKDWYPEEFKTFSSDTMNSMAITLIQYVKKRKLLKGQKDQISIATIGSNVEENEDFMKMMKSDGTWGEWDNFAKNVGCIGNFVLVPYMFNSFRKNLTQDYWDTSLILLHEGDANFYGRKVWNHKDFNKYINTFFLWDYVEKYTGEAFTPYPLFGNKRPEEDCGRCKPERWKHGRFGTEKNYENDEYNPATKSEREKLLPNTGEVQEFLKNANRLIERRSIFMAAMLQIAVKYKDDYEKIMKYLTTPDNSTVEFKDLDEAVEKLPRRAKLGKEASEILRVAKSKLGSKPLQDNSGSNP